eukprot:TRINITY_DN74660_c0_g1_i1.p1 TRINITY_DN74660_c0_g1~~TRINITY_DN74660_c0_g1_i1.p1  ORF type:complete len:312 (-),score=83.45 TRINITY_DN74660_c0_g1_i1:115-1050(-)
MSTELFKALGFSFCNCCESLKAENDCHVQQAPPPACPMAEDEIPRGAGMAMASLVQAQAPSKVANEKPAANVVDQELGPSTPKADVPAPPPRKELGPAPRQAAEEAAARQNGKAGKRTSSPPRGSINPENAPGRGPAKPQTVTVGGMGKGVVYKGGEDLEEANKLLDRQKYQEACGAFSKILAQEPNNVAALAKRGACWLRISNDAKAAEDLNKALSLDPCNLCALSDRAELNLKLGHFEAAVLDLDKKLARSPVDGKALYMRGEAKLRSGLQQKAVLDLAMAVNLSHPGALELLEKAQAGLRTANGTGTS